MKPISLKKVSLIVLLAGLVSGVSQAEKINPDNNEKLTIETIKANTAKVIPVAFSAFDSDKNGSLSKEEIKAGNDDSLKIAFDKMDKDGNGQLSEDEFNQALALIN